MLRATRRRLTAALILSSCLIFGGLVSTSARAAAQTAPAPVPAQPAEPSPGATDNTLLPTPPPLNPEFKADPGLGQLCQTRLKKIPGSAKLQSIEPLCNQARQLPACASRKKEAIFHIERTGENKQGTVQKILVFSLVHGDEEPSGSVALAWLDRLNSIQPRNSWRVIPILNPDGWDAKTRTNAAGVDINRNFPSKDWRKLALEYWNKRAQKNDRRFPGEQPASEPETLCAMQHIADFDPDFIISVHTPLGVLDFDGPKMEYPKFGPLPWVSLGNYPGSLGRYMWMDRGVPVLTVELKNQMSAAKNFEAFDRLQDITGTVAIQAEKILKRKKAPEKNPTSVSQNLEASTATEPTSTSPRTRAKE